MASFFKRVGAEFVSGEAGGSASKLVALPDGGFFAFSWTFDYYARDLVGWRFDSSGAKVGAQITVAEDIQPFNPGFGLDVAALASGNFLITFTSNDMDVFGRIYGPAGTPLTGDFLLHSITENQQSKASITPVAGGGFVAVWIDSYNPQVGNESIRGQVFTAAGVKAGPEFTVNTDWIQGATPEVVALGGGGFAVLWEEDGYSRDLIMQVFNSSGGKVGTETVVNTATAGTQHSIQSAALSNGGFVAVWTDEGAYDPYNPVLNIRAQMFDASGNKIGGEILVNPDTYGSHNGAAVVGLPGGGFVVAWQSQPGDGSETAITAQVFGSAGARSGDAFVVNTQTDGAQTGVSLAALANGGFAVSWSSNDFDPLPSGPRTQIFAPITSGPQDLALSAGTLIETATENMAVAQIFEPNGRANGGLTFQLVEDSTRGAFRIEGNSLVVADSRRLDFETAPVVTVRIRAVDVEGHAYEETLTLNIADVAAETRFAAGLEVTSVQSGIQFDTPSIVPLSSGKFIAITTGFDGYTFVEGQFLNADATPLGTPFRLNPTAVHSHFGGGAAPLASGGFAATWVEYGEYGANVAVQAFDASGARVGNQVVFELNARFDSSIVQLGSGGFIVAWVDNTPEAGTDWGTALRAQGFDSSGGQVGNTFLLNTTIEGIQEALALAATPGGGFIAVWRDDLSVRAQRFDSTGARSGTEMLLFTTSPEQAPVELTATVLADGSIVVGWRNMDRFPYTGLFFHLSNAAGAELTGTIKLHDRHTSESTPGFAALPNGGFVATWMGNDDDSFGVWAQQYSASGQPVGAQFLVNTGEQGGQRHPGVVFTPGSGLVFSWTDDIGTIESRTFPLADSFSEGTAAANVVNGTAGADAWRGLGGDDVFRLWQGGNDIAHGNDGNDSFLLGAALGAGDEIDGGAGNDALVLQGSYTYTFSASNLIGIETLALMAGNDTRFGAAGTAFHSYLLATIDANVAAGATLTVYARDLRAGETLNFNGAAETNGAFDIQSGAGNDTLVAGAGNDSLDGGGGNDSLDGGAGADTMRGGLGNDIYFVAQPGDQAIETAGQGVDEVRTGLGSASDYGAMYVLPANIENFTGTSASGQGIYGNALDNVVVMGAGNDLVVLEDGGVDRVSGGAGSDFFYFGAAFTGADVAIGGDGFDTVGLLGAYNLALGAGSLQGIEKLAVYSSGNPAAPNAYVLAAHDGNVAAGKSLMVVATSLGGGESLHFNGQAEMDGSFNIRGGKGADTLIGGLGNDRFHGNLGADTLKGGGGNDFIEYESAAESTASARDTILDFSAGDRISLVTIDADGAAASGNGKFAWIGASAFTGAAGQLRVSQAVGGGFLVEGDVNGDGTADLSILVHTLGNHILTANDFLL
ncbi:MAG TPA: M10 family metallopeptidase C-terminal domain-containing protein [Allosphingosinicella sp.]